MAVSYGLRLSKRKRRNRPTPRTPGLSTPIHNYGLVHTPRTPIHPVWLRCSSVIYLDIMNASRLASRAPRRSRYVTVIMNQGPKGPRKNNYRFLDPDPSCPIPSGGVARRSYIQILFTSRTLPDRRPYLLVGPKKELSPSPNLSLYNDTTGPSSGTYSCADPKYPDS